MTTPDFVAAQERILARRSLRQAEIQAEEARRNHQFQSSRLSRLPYPLSQAGRAGVNLWDLIKGREGTRPSFRVGQVDAELLDEELLALLKSQVGESLKYYGSHLQDEWSPEILLMLRAILFKLSIWDHNASYGASLQNLRYSDARNKSAVPELPTLGQKSLYGLFTVVGRYAWTKWGNWLVDQEGGYEEPSDNVRALSHLTSTASTLHSIAGFASFLIFLVNGRYRTLTDRILRLRLVSPSSQISREVSFEYLNRQLVWHAFTEFLLFLLPLVGITRWRRWLAKAWRKTKNVLKSSGDEGQEITKSGGELSFLPERTCAICYQDQNPTNASEQDIMAASSGGVIGSAQTDITNPYETVPCGCIYCFVCLAQRLDAEEGDGWVCLRCGEIVKECKPWDGDVVQEVSHPTSGISKSVGFIDNSGDKPEDDEEEAVFSPQEEQQPEELPQTRSLFDDAGLQDSIAWSEVVQSFPTDSDERTPTEENYI